MCMNSIKLCRRLLYVLAFSLSHQSKGVKAIVRWKEKISSFCQQQKNIFHETVKRYISSTQKRALKRRVEPNLNQSYSEYVFFCLLLKTRRETVMERNRDIGCSTESSYCHSQGSQNAVTVLRPGMGVNTISSIPIPHQIYQFQMYRF